MTLCSSFLTCLSSPVACHQSAPLGAYEDLYLSVLHRFRRPTLIMINLEAVMQHYSCLHDISFSLSELYPYFFLRPASCLCAVCHRSLLAICHSRDEGAPYIEPFRRYLGCLSQKSALLSGVFCAPHPQATFITIFEEESLPRHVCLVTQHSHLLGILEAINATRSMSPLLPRCCLITNVLIAHRPADLLSPASYHSKQ
ncbi:hypothetical protein EDD37DRAFT_76500 [Exophiala viscosa]|uniref:uncharacterized protein n=1 Tax=Exophiala viscosa TaxID=2486360 RepID=UPI00219A354F|nr:hypothetical protein EDD37DRAFT_76500 [Exophiala viscosa]